MAYIRKRRRKKKDGTHVVRWEVRWRDPDGSQHGRSFPNQRAAKVFTREVEEVVASGRRWEDPDRQSPEALERVVEAYLKSLKRTQRSSTRVIVQPLGTVDTLRCPPTPAEASA